MSAVKQKTRTWLHRHRIGLTWVFVVYLALDAGRCFVAGVTGRFGPLRAGVLLLVTAACLVINASNLTRWRRHA